MTELDRLKVIQSVVGTMLKPGFAVERLHLSVRQVERLVLRYQLAGAAGVVSRTLGRLGNRKIDDGTAYRALILIRDRYADFWTDAVLREAARMSRLGTFQENRPAPDD